MSDLLPAVVLQPGDLILRVNGSAAPDLETFKSLFEAIEWGDKVNLGIMRDGRERVVRMVLRQ